MERLSRTPGPLPRGRARASSSPAARRASLRVTPGREEPLALPDGWVESVAFSGATVLVATPSGLFRQTTAGFDPLPGAEVGAACELRRSLLGAGSSPGHHRRARRRVGRRHPGDAARRRQAHARLAEGDSSRRHGPRALPRDEQGWQAGSRAPRPPSRWPLPRGRPRPLRGASPRRALRRGLSSRERRPGTASHSRPFRERRPGASTRSSPPVASSASRAFGAPRATTAAGSPRSTGPGAAFSLAETPGRSRHWLCTGRPAAGRGSPVRVPRPARQSGPGPLGGPELLVGTPTGLGCHRWTPCLVASHRGRGATAPPLGHEPRANRHRGIRRNIRRWYRPTRSGQAREHAPLRCPTTVPGGLSRDRRPQDQHRVPRDRRAGRVYAGTDGRRPLGSRSGSRIGSSGWSSCCRPPASPPCSSTATRSGSEPTKDSPECPCSTATAD